MSTVILTFQTSKTFYMKYYADQCHVHRPNYLYIYWWWGAYVIVGDRGVATPKGGGGEGRWSPETF
jgi:hypothetical protein